MRHRYALGILLAALSCAGAARLAAQGANSGNWQDYLIPDGKTVYDAVNGVTWLRDTDLSASDDTASSQDKPPRFGLPACDVDSTEPCIWPNGAMSYTTAQEWVARMNAASYLGHSHWRLPSTPNNDPGCKSIGPSKESFGFGCSAGALGFLYYTALGIKAPDTAVPIPPNTVGLFSNFQPDIYWSSSYGGGLPNNIANFSFADGAQGGTNKINYAYVLPMVKGKIPGTPRASGMGLQLNPDGKTVYDPIANVTWVADANLAAQEAFGLPPCKTPGAPHPCVDVDGSMDYDSAELFIAGMNAANYGTETADQLNWELPPSDPGCPQFNCTKSNPMGELYYTQLGLQAGMSVVPVPEIAVGPFHHLQPGGYYWSCRASTIDHPCTDNSPVPNMDAEFDFSFGKGFLSTARKPGLHFVTVYFVGCDLPNAIECVHVKDPGPRKF